MLNRLKTVAVAALLLTTVPLHARDPRIVVEANFVGVRTDEVRSRGHVQLTVVNSTDAELRQVSLRLVTPSNGSLGEGAVEFGGIAVGETAVRSVEFDLDRSSFESNEPFVVTLTYNDTAGENREATLAVRRVPDGGDL